MVIEALPDIADLTARQLATRIREGSLATSDVVEDYVSRAREIQARYNPIVVPLFEAALAAARRTEPPTGALAGVPISIKEQFLVLGTPTTWGLAHRSGHRAQTEGTLIRRLRAAGAIPIAKTNVPQLLIFMETDNPLYGRTDNPWDPGRAPGGSSGGEGCLVAMRGSAVGFGGDLGGSIRVPAHFCGIHGFAPSEGRLPLDDNPTDIMPPMVTIEPRAGPMARHVDDLILVMAALAPEGVGGGTDPDLPPIVIPASVRGLRIGWYDDDHYFPASPAIRRATAEAAAALEVAGAHVVRFEPPAVGEAIRLMIGAGGDTPSSLHAALAGEAPDRRIAGLIRMGTTPGPLRSVIGWGMGAAGQARLSGLIGAMRARRPGWEESVSADLAGYRARFATAMAVAGVDVIVCPPYAVPAMRHGQSEQLSIWSTGSYATLFSVLGYAAGVVAASRVRVGEESDRAVGRDATDRAARAAEIGSAGLPVGVQVAAAAGQDGPVLAVMSELESFFRSRPEYPNDPR
jgi:Asp-tRNA(Asn)/Glu-tRNA(Gln) amidotransferase A subunit family amidase